MSPISLQPSMSILSNTTDSNSVAVAVSLGSNLPYLNRSPREVVLAAIQSLRRISIESQASSLYLSEPIGCAPGAEGFHQRRYGSAFGLQGLCWQVFGGFAGH